MRRRRLTLAAALLFSVLLHLLVVGGGTLALPDLLAFTPDEVLESRMPAHVQQVRLERTASLPRPTAMPKPPLASLPAPRPDGEDVAQASSDSLPVNPKTQAQAQAQELSAMAATSSKAPEPRPALSTPVALPAPGAPEPGTPTSTSSMAPAYTAAAAATDPAPAFPVQLSARIEARLNGLSTTLEQDWLMEGLRYAIAIKGQKFGIGAQLTSEGRILPEGGLLPERSQITWGGRLQSFTEYRSGNIRLGSPENPRELPLPIIPQDLASVPFHLAVTFTGQPQTVFISTGQSVYQSRFTLVAEEKLKLPVGTLRTLHLSGERFDHELREMVRDFDIWLAPDYLNFPVKVSGHLRSGEPLEYRVQYLEIEGRQVLGMREDRTPVVSDDAIPSWLRERARAQGLNIR